MISQQQLNEGLLEDSVPEKKDEEHLTDVVHSLFEEAAALQLNLSHDDSVYDLNYISDKLAKSSFVQEKLAELQMRLTRISLVVIRAGGYDKLRKTIKEVKEAVANQVQTMRRLDSDIRLHHKLLEAKVAAGADGIMGYKSDKKDEINL